MLQGQAHLLPPQNLTYAPYDSMISLTFRLIENIIKINE